ncbi:hypothetical protein M5C99_13725 [Acidovorax sp. NCPPB 2350]|nr:hypothetical protein M5C99_13725 [Acidovorax sp. NCPPB 2350]
MAKKSGLLFGQGGPGTDTGQSSARGHRCWRGEVHSSGATMWRVEDATGNFSALVQAISQFSMQQSGGISQVNDAIVCIEEGIPQNAALVEQASAAAESLCQQVVNLVALMARAYSRAAEQSVRSALAEAHRVGLAEFFNRIGRIQPEAEG